MCEMDWEKKQEKSQIFKYSKLQSFLGEKKKVKLYVLPIFFYSHYKNRTAAEELTRSFAMSHN